jgi:hypothetical protein
MMIEDSPLSQLFRAVDQDAQQGEATAADATRSPSPSSASITSGNDSPVNTSGHAHNSAQHPGIGAANRRLRTQSHPAYRDCSRSVATPEECERLAAVRANAALPTAARSRHHHAKEPTFPHKLHMILSRPEWDDILTWQPHGRSFRILNPAAFEELVLPFYFHHGKYSSFARQLNGWNFRRISRGDDFNTYYHEV